MKKITLSISMIVFVGLIVIGATTAFFSDTETSAGNTFSAGEIDLLVGNDSYMVKDGSIEKMVDNTWEIQSDIAGDDKLFFDFEDIKPGDLAEDTISLRVDTNDAWACMKGDITDSTSGGHPDATNDDGHLHEEIQMIFWADDGDNVYENDETEKIVWEGTAADLFDGDWKTIADSENSVFDDLGDNGELLGGEEYHLAKAWCHGELEEDPVNDDNNENPEDRGETGFTCDGEDIGNASQGDSFGVDVDFYAVQSRNNDDFRCDEYNGDQEDGDEIISTTESGFPDVNKAWMTSARYGNNDPESGDWELAIKRDGDSTPWIQDGKDWGDSPTDELDFELDYNGTTTTFTVDGVEIESDDMSGVNGLIGIAAKTNADDGEDGKVTVSDIKIDGTAPSGPDSFTAQGTDDPSRGLEHMVLDSVSGPFTLTGKLKFEWGSSPSDEGPGFEIHIEDQS